MTNVAAADRPSMTIAGTADHRIAINTPSRNNALFSVTNGSLSFSYTDLNAKTGGAKAAVAKFTDGDYASLTMDHSVFHPGTAYRVENTVDVKGNVTSYVNPEAFLFSKTGEVVVSLTDSEVVGSASKLFNFGKVTKCSVTIENSLIENEQLWDDGAAVTNDVYKVVGFAFNNAATTGTLTAKNTIFRYPWRLFHGVDGSKVQVNLDGCTLACGNSGAGDAICRTVKVTSNNTTFDMTKRAGLSTDGKAPQAFPTPASGGSLTLTGYTYVSHYANLTRSVTYTPSSDGAARRLWYIAGADYSFLYATAAEAAATGENAVLAAESRVYLPQITANALSGMPGGITSAFKDKWGALMRRLHRTAGPICASITSMGLPPRPRIPMRTSLPASRVKT